MDFFSKKYSQENKNMIVSHYCTFWRLVLRVYSWLVLDNKSLFAWEIYQFVKLKTLSFKTLPCRQLPGQLLKEFINILISFWNFLLVLNFILFFVVKMERNFDMFFRSYPLYSFSYEIILKPRSVLVNISREFISHL